MTRGRLVRAATALAALGVLPWLLDHIGWDEAGAMLARVDLGAAALLVALGMTETFLDALALRVPVRFRVGRARMFGYQSAGALVNAVVPFEAGEVLKGTLILRHVTTAEAISGTIVWNYVFKLARPIAALAIATVGLAGAGMPLPRRVAMALVAATLLGFAPYLALRIAVRAGMAGMVVRLGRLFRLLHKDPALWRERAERVDHAVRSFWAERRLDFLRILALQIGARLASFASTLVALRVLGMPVGIGTGALIHAGLSAAEYLLLFLPARVGVAESAAYVVFQLYGLDPAVGVLTALLLRLRALTANGLGALFCLGEERPLP